MRAKDAWPLGAIAFILAVTAGWWTLALWSVPGAPEWLERTRSVCFNITETGLPDAKGWLLLLGQPPTMLAVLLVGWYEEVRGSLRRLLGTAPGKATAAMTTSLALVGFSLAGATVRGAQMPDISVGVDEPAPETYPRLDRAWPEPIGLVDQSGEAFSLGRLEGRAAMVTFAFGNCRTVCPLVVHQARATRLEVERELAIVVFTLDPWRDTPSRLGSLVDQFELDATRDFVVSGEVEDVEANLDGWNMPRERDELTGDITHPAIVYLVEPDGTVAYGSTGGVRQMASLAERLR
jgi:cytochrome oxidase Cu insertion factor (SCO1/SenC/PrrC family)